MKNDSSIELCSCNTIHEESVNKARESMLDEETLRDLTDMLKVFGDPTRLKIIKALSVCEMCVCDLAYALEMTQSSISHQLRLLKRERIVKFRKEGKMVYYLLDDNHVYSILTIALEHINE